MSHELRSPLNAILGFTQRMASGTPAPRRAQKKSIDQILQAGWYLLALINEILDLALIESGKLSQLLQPFNRLGQEAGVEEGTGIGQVVSKRLVEWMGGEMGVDSMVGAGSVIWIELDSAQAPSSFDATSEPRTAALPLWPPGTSMRTLLCVEDNPANLMLVEKLLVRRPDLRLLTARDGNSGIEMARASRPDVILMDINLPGISGLQAMARLALYPETARIPVVALSANAMPADIEKGLEAGFSATSASHS